MSLLKKFMFFTLTIVVLLLTLEASAATVLIGSTSAFYWD